MSKVKASKASKASEATKKTTKKTVEPGLIEHLGAGDVEGQLEIIISYEIIKLFSEGLYQSPHKAVEELVSNAFDAGAQNVHVLMPADEKEHSLWVVDDGAGMDKDGFARLWEIANSPKNIDDAVVYRGRDPIGQFGIGKLAAYVLAWRLTHVSKAAGKYLFTSMNFRDITGHQWTEHKPISLELRQLNEDAAKAMLAEIRERDKQAWKRLFGKDAAESWTVAALTDFKDLAGRMQEGTLAWVLRTALPLLSDFAIFLNGTELQPAKADWTPILTLPVGGDSDESAEKLNLNRTDAGIAIDGIGEIRGEARLYERALAGGKSDQYGRSHGFFIRVRGRVINLEDELFGLDVLNHAVWARFTMDIEADGLREYLLSSREGVRESQPVEILRKYLLLKFNEFRSYYAAIKKEELVGIDITQLLSEAPSPLVTEPLVEAIRSEVMQPGRQLYYISAPEGMDAEEAGNWIAKFAELARDRPFDSVEAVPAGPYGRLAEYVADERRLVINTEHPLMAKIIAHSTSQAPATLLASAEVLTDALVRHFGFDDATAAEFFLAREKVLRLLAGDEPPVAAEVLRLLDAADQDETAMERAVGAAFSVLGMEYEKRGGSSGGTDGLLHARLGRQGGEMADYRLVFDAKTSDRPRIAAAKVDCAALNDFKKEEAADFAFAIGRDFEASENPKGALNRRAKNEKVSVIRTRDLKRLVELHLTYGLTLKQIRKLFESAYSIPDTERWVNDLATELATPNQQVPLRVLLEALEGLKTDELAAPSVEAARQTEDVLRSFTPDKLVAVLRAAATIVDREWIEFDPRGSGVHLQQSPDQIVAEVQRVLAEETNQGSSSEGD